MQAFVVRKDPDARKDYEFDWRQWLNGDTLVSVQFILNDGASVTVDAQSFTAEGVVLVWLTSGAEGATDYITCRITTAQNRVEDWTMQVNVRTQ